MKTSNIHDDACIAVGIFWVASPRSNFAGSRLLHFQTAPPPIKLTLQLQFELSPTSIRQATNNRINVCRKTRYDRLPWGFDHSSVRHRINNVKFFSKISPASGCMVSNVVANQRAVGSEYRVYCFRHICSQMMRFSIIDLYGDRSGIEKCRHLTFA